MVVVGVLLGSSSAAGSRHGVVASVLLPLLRRIDGVPQFSSLASRRDDGTTRSACRNLHGHLPCGHELCVGIADCPSSRPLEVAAGSQVQPSSWSRLPLPLPPAAGGPTTFSPAATSFGLLAFLSDASGHKTLLLANPITRLLAALPITPTPRFSPTIGLATGPTSIILVVARDDLVSPFAVKNISAMDACGRCAAAATEVE
uniref:Uncharacterized protein n=1 Tax=Oryza meridionalis TaxID=40149 RepID=A0A0E0E7B9_9ORYZ